MKKILLSGLIAATIIASSVAQASHKGRWQGHDGMVDYGRVIDVEPITRVVRVSAPRRECWEEEVRYPVHARGGHIDSAGNMIIGGIIGGVIGHQIGRHIHHGRGKNAATLAGTLVGASIGHDAAARRPREVTGERLGYERGYEQVCKTINDYHTEEQIDGYRVTYRYHGKTFHTRMDRHPGKRVRVHVSVSPIRD